MNTETGLCVFTCKLSTKCTKVQDYDATKPAWSEFADGLNDLTLELVLGVDGVLDALLGPLRVSPKFAVTLALQRGKKV